MCGCVAAALLILVASMHTCGVRACGDLQDAALQIVRDYYRPDWWYQDKKLWGIIIGLNFDDDAQITALACAFAQAESPEDALAPLGDSMLVDWGDTWERLGAAYAMLENDELINTLYEFWDPYGYNPKPGSAEEARYIEAKERFTNFKALVQKYGIDDLFNNNPDYEFSADEDSYEDLYDEMKELYPDLFTDSGL